MFCFAAVCVVVIDGRGVVECGCMFLCVDVDDVLFVAASFFLFIWRS